MTTRIMIVKLLRFLRLNRLIAKLYYDHVHGFASAGKELPDTVRRCMQRAIEMGTAEQGEYYEFGIFKGHTFYHAQKSASELGLKKMRFFGFDSFQGLPKPTKPRRSISTRGSTPARMIRWSPRCPNTGLIGTARF